MSSLEFLRKANLKKLQTMLTAARPPAYTVAMNTRKPILTKDNTKMLAVEVSTHQLARELAARLDVPIYVAVSKALQMALTAYEARPAADMAETSIARA